MANHKAWPPSDDIEALLISMHITRDSKILKAMLCGRGREYLMRHSPVGTRDTSTQKLLQENGIDAYFSGCLTLTLPKFKGVKKEDYVLAIDISDELFDFLRSHTHRTIYRMRQNSTLYAFLPFEQKHIFAEHFLRLEQSASCVVTNRLHTAMPCLALGVPVMLVNTACDQYRFDGLRELLHNASEAEYINDYEQFNLDSPPPNSDDYLPIRERLIKTCEEFMGIKAAECISLNGITNQEDAAVALTNMLCNVDFKKGRLARTLLKAYAAKGLHTYISMDYVDLG